MRAVEYLKRVGAGVTSPVLMRAEDGEAYVVKLMRNRLGPKVLANEFLAAEIGEWLDLCFPPSGIIDVGEDVAASRRAKAARVLPGRHFASRFLAGAVYVNAWNIREAENLRQMAGVMLFDHLFFNLDRTWNRKNLLLYRQGQARRIYAIDHTHLFGRGRWTAEILAKLADKIVLNWRGAFGWLLGNALAPYDFAPYVARWQAMTDGQCGELISRIPEEWLPEAGEREALRQFLIRRRDLAGAAAAKICSLIPDKHRRAKIH